MFSRRTVFLPALAAAAGVLSGGCFEFGPSQAPRAALNTQSLDTSCLQRSGPTVQAYLDQSLSDLAPVHQFWSCLSRSMQLFAERVRGQTPGSYAANELRYFVQSEFLPGARISDELLAEVFEFKRFLFGGDAASITTGEIARAQELIETLRAQSVALYPELPVMVHLRAGLDVDEADRTLRSISDALLPWLTREGSSISLTHVQRLLEGLQDAATDASVKATLSAVRLRLPLARLLKEQATGSGDPDLISAREWAILLDIGRRSLFAGLKFEMLARSGLSVLQGDGRRILSDILGSVFTLLDEVVARQPGGVLRFETLDAIVGQLLPDDLPIQAQTLKDFIRTAFQHYFGGRVPGECGVDATGVCAASLRRAWAAFHHWSMAQDYLETLYARLGGSPEGYTAAELSAPTLEELYGLPVPALDPALVDAAAEMREIVLTERPLYLHDDLRISFLTAPGDRHTLFNQTQANWQHEIVRLLMEAYASRLNPDPGRDTATYADFEQMYLGIRELGREFKIMDSRSDIVLSQRFVESNLFMEASDGDDSMSVGEGVGMIAYLISSKGFSNEIHAEASAHCPLGEIDTFGSPRIEFDCFRKIYFQNVERWWTHVPSLLADYQSLDAASREDFQQTLLLASFGASVYGKPVGTGDIDGLAMIPQYLESIFTRYDLPRSGVFNLAEAETAFPVFADKIAQVSGISNRFQNLSLFTYLLAFGKAPAQNAGGILSLLGWEAQRPFWKSRIHADRRTLLHVFAALGAQPPKS